jgi:Tol biopolymer transport system component
MALVQRAIDQDIYRLNIAENRSEKFIATTKGDGQAIYSPDGEKIVFLSKQTGESAVWICDKNGQNAHQLLSSLGSSPSWSPDGTQIAVDGIVDKSRQYLFCRWQADLRNV